jgi:hypothetical protein
MKILRLLFLGSFLFMLSACGSVDNIRADAQGQSAEWLVQGSPTAQSQEIKAQSTPSPIPSPMPTAEPTINAAATTAAINLAAAEKNYQAAEIQAKAITDAANIEATALIEKGKSEENVANAAILLQQAKNDEQALINKNIELQEKLLEEQNNAVALGIEDKYASARIVVIVAGVVLIAVLIIIFSIKFLRDQHREPAQPANTKQVIHISDGGQTDRVPPPPGTLEALHDWMLAGLAGRSLAINEWEQSGQYDGDYRELYVWAGRWKLLMRQPQTGWTVLSERGVRVCRAWMAANPLPHHEIDAELAPIPSMSMDSMHMDGGGGGG